MVENFPNSKKETDMQIQEGQRVPNEKNPNRPTPRPTHHFIVIKMGKVKYKNTNLKAANLYLKTERKRQRKGISIRLSANFSAETQEARKE